jgi:PAS domain S-box-containing protein
LENNQSYIIKYWSEDLNLISILKKHNVKMEYFIENYAISVLRYYIDIINDKTTIGKCPAIEALIKYLKSNNITTSELFLICSAFRNAIVQFLFEQKICDAKLFDEINNIYEKNFSSLLTTYTNSIKDVEVKLDKISAMVDKYIIMSQTDVHGVIINASEAFCKISGYTKEELIGKPHNIVRDPNVPDELFVDLWETIKSGKIWHGELSNRAKDGSIYWVDATIEPIFENGKIIAYNAIRHDITSQKKVKAQQNMIIEQSKSAAMGEMISMIAHQWRQPLQAVSILTQKLPLLKMIDGDIKDEILNKVVDDVAIQLDYMSKTIDDFRNFFKPDKNKEKVELSKLILKVEEFLSYMLKIEKVKVNLSYDEDVIINIHYNEVMQVFINIIKNAVDAMVEHDIKNRYINISFYKENQNVVIAFEDNAGGIKEEFLSKIFDPYFSTKTNKNGTGLGLYMSKTIIEEHSGGKISVKNGKEGAIFTITLPLEKE